MTTPRQPPGVRPADILAPLAGEDFDWYRDEEDLPSARDVRVTAAVQHYQALGSAEERRLFSEAADPYSAHTLVSFAERCASIALQTKSVAPLKQALAAIAWQWQACEDPCDGIAVLGAVYDACQRLGEAPIPLFEAAVAYAPPGVERAFPDFLSRTDLHEIAAAMGYLVRPSPQGLRYLRSW
ncbi:MAG: hypothetical protein KA712_11115 [Myxococcales bacterium]|nr:hypothetical protein [Myxococcales bacterium]